MNYCAIQPDQNGWRLLPGGDYVKLGDGVKLGNGVTLGDYVTLGDGVKIHVGRYVAQFAECEGYSKILTDHDGVAWISAGCRSMSLGDAVKYWRKRDDRKHTYALLHGAWALAKHLGLKVR